ncbi:hypothetical protein COOONC_06375 [Cooperia oncophora]
MRTIALEGRCFVISSAQFMTSSAYPEGHPMRIKHGDDKKNISSYVDVDLSRIACGKMDLDTVGHYSRPEVFQLIVNEKPCDAVVRR